MLMMWRVRRRVTAGMAAGLAASMAAAAHRRVTPTVAPFVGSIGGGRRSHPDIRSRTSGHGTVKRLSVRVAGLLLQLRRIVAREADLVIQFALLEDAHRIKRSVFKTIRE